MPGSDRTSDYPYQHLYERDGFTCQFCGWNGQDDFQHWWVANFSITHVKPPIHGGGDTDDNLVLACHACIQHKSDADCDTLDEARRIVAANRSHAEAFFKKHVARSG